MGVHQQAEATISRRSALSDGLFRPQIVDFCRFWSRTPRTATAILAGALAGSRLWLSPYFLAPPLSCPRGVTVLRLALPALAFFVSIMDYASFSWARDRLQIIPMMWDQRENYAFNGFTFAFALNLPMAHVSAPHGYSPEAIQTIRTPTSIATVPSEKPDIIIVMSESFWTRRCCPA